MSWAPGLSGRRFLPAIIAVLVLAAAPFQVRASVEAGLDALELGDYEGAFGEWRSLARGGDMRAQYGMGIIAYKGPGTYQNHLRAAQWFRKAARQGHALAQVYLGRMYEKGLGIPKSGSKAISWYRRAAEQGNALAQVILGFKYTKGEGVRRDPRLAHMWFDLAAERGHRKAYKYLERVARNMAVSDINAAQQMAQIWLAKHASLR